MSSGVEFRSVSRRYGSVRAVNDVSLQIKAGEFFAMLGPSGSGKTTCLRLIAGFESADAGSIWIGGTEVSARPPYERDVNTVFQDYALFPHMSVLDNVAYPLLVRKVSRGERHARAKEMLGIVQLAEMADRSPAQLSGGQRQRVALARALINRPAVLLLDEPLGALDLKLREQMQIELKQLQRQLGTTFVFVTHDQGEALSMADRVAVFNAGKIEQLDAPRVLYTRPRSAFVARFVGGANVADRALAARLGGASAFAIRPELVDITTASGTPPVDAMQTEGTLLDVQYHGAASRWQVQLDGGGHFVAARAERAGDASLAPGARVRLSWAARDAVPLEDHV